MPNLTQQLATFPAESQLQALPDPFPKPVPIQVFIKRDDLLHPQVSGNKWRKLKYNLLAAREQGFTTLLTFGGAYSNHLYALAAAGQAFGFQTIGIVRGDEAAIRQTPTLNFCRTCGMQLHFVSRTDFRQKESTEFVAALAKQFGPFYLIPEGGTNALAIRGAAEIFPEITQQLGCPSDYVCCAVGTGGTALGLATSTGSTTKVLGFLALKAPTGFTLPDFGVDTTYLQLIYDYHFGGYAKTKPELIDFMLAFERNTGILLEQVYTAKMLYGIYDLAQKGYFPQGSTVVAVHTGGLQGRLAGLLGY